MVHGSPLVAARRHPSLTFGVSGGAFALLFLLVASAPDLFRGDYAPSGVEAALIVGGFAGGFLLARALWARLDGARSPVRGAAVGGLIGLLALPVPMYLLELGAVALTGLEALNGVPLDPGSGAPSWMRAVEYAFLLLVTPLALGALGLIATRGGTVVVGAVTGYLLARR